MEIDVAVVGERVFLTVYSGSLNGLVNGRTKVYEVPTLRVRDLLSALHACQVAQ